VITNVAAAVKPPSPHSVITAPAGGHVTVVGQRSEGQDVVDDRPARTRERRHMGRRQPGLVSCPPDCSWEEARCPGPRCADYAHIECYHRKCPAKGRCTEPIESAVNKTLEVIWKHTPPPPPVQPNTPRLILLTVSFPHALQLLKLRHCARVLADVPNTLWMVAEDAAKPSTSVADLLRHTGKPYRHIAFGPTRKGGNAQRDALLQIIRRERLEGIGYMMDDDNAYHPTLWLELRRLRPMRVGVLACGAARTHHRGATASLTCWAPARASSSAIR
jgi:hypothetical protein